MIELIKLSFIVPFYNVEKYIGVCLDSLYAQDIPEEEYEVICVDDCSPDNSKSIVREYQKQHANLVLIEHTENKCLGGARNTGIRAAKGQYIWFIDSDDMIKTHCLKHLLSNCIETNPDVLLFNFEKVDMNGVLLKQEIVFPHSEVFTGLDYAREVMKGALIYNLGFVWRMMFKTSYLRERNLLFPEHVFWEDTVFMPKTLLYAEKVSSLEECYYQYRTNPASVSGIFQKQYRADLVYQFAFVAGYDLMMFANELRIKDKELDESLHQKSLNYINGFIISLLRTTHNEQEKFFVLIQQNKDFIQKLLPFMNRFNRFVCRNPDFSRYLAACMKPFYIIKRKRIK